MPRKSTKIPSFYDWLMHFYLKDPDRYALAYNMKKLASRHPDFRKIDSLTDFMIASGSLTDPDARNAATPDLWCEYCAMTGHEMT